jgi:hypothetical protein
MTPLQNDPQQHQREAKHRTFSVPHGVEWSPDSNSARTLLQKSGLDAEFGSRKFDFTSNSGGGTTAGAPTPTRASPGPLRMVFRGNPPKFAEQSTLSKSQNIETIATPAAAPPSAGRGASRRRCWCRDFFIFLGFVIFVFFANFRISSDIWGGQGYP